MKLYEKIGVLTIIIAVLLSCNNSNNEDKDNTLEELELTAERNALRSISAVTIKPDNTYVDLKTGRVVRVRMDTITRNIYDVKTKYPIDYVIDLSTMDTFDRMGRIINQALILDKDGTWILDESRLEKPDDKNN